MVDEHRAALCLTDEPNDFTDAYLKAMVKEGGKSDSTFSGETQYPYIQCIMIIICFYRDTLMSIKMQGKM